MSNGPDIDALYRSHGAVVLRRARQLLGNPADAEEVLQDVFATLLRRPELVARVERPTAYLYQLTTRACLNRIRNKNTRTRLLAVQQPAVDTTSATQELHAELREVLASLTDDEAHAVVFHHVDQMSQAEVASRMGCSRRWISQLLARVRQRFGKEEPAQC